MPLLFTSPFLRQSSALIAAILLSVSATLQAALEEYTPSLLVEAARKQVGVTVSYDPNYRAMSYPGGDVPSETGVCTDVVIRALRHFSFDLQKEVHEEMRAHFSRYPKRWGLKGPDRNIDHRRVPNLEVFFERRGWRIPLKKPNGEGRTSGEGNFDYSVFQTGDIVTCLVGERLPHIVIISDKRDSSGEPFIIHNIGAGTQEEVALSRFKITGHYRIKSR